MGRVIRRLARRIKYFGIGVVFSAAIYHRWQYRRSAVMPLPQGQQNIQVETVSNLSSMTVDNLFDVLIVGGNLIALYTAVDAAQRGLCVAVIADHDFNAQTDVETVLPGAFPFMQKAIRQRDWRIFCQGLQALAAFTTWLNVAPFCIDKHTEGCLLSSPSQISDFKKIAKKLSVLEEVEIEQEHEVKTEESECKQTLQQRWHLFRSFPAVKTYVPAMSLTELSEFMFAAMVSTIISPLYGPWRPCTVVWPYKARKCINMKEDFAQGGVIAHDCAFDANKATLALLRTAEALGVTLLNYTSVESFEYCNTQGEDGKSYTSETIGEHSPAVIIRANVHVHSTSSHVNQNNKCKVNKSVLHIWNKKEPATFTLPVYTRGVINCAGNEADRIKALVPNNEKEIIPFAYDSYMAYSYLVTPRSAINFTSHEQHQARELRNKRSTRWIDKTDAFMISSTRFILRPTCMLLPWYDNCILIGPYTHLIESSAERSERTKEKALNAHKYDNEVNEITTMCKYAGVEVDKTQILSCLTSFMPVLRRAEALSWIKELVQKGYHIDISSKRSAIDDGNTSSNTDKELLFEERQFDNTKNRKSNNSTTFDVTKDINTTTQTSKITEVSKLKAQPFIHLYGGIALFARDIAEELVNTYLNNTCALSDAQQQALCKSCATRYLGLLPPSQEFVELMSTSTLQNTHKESHPEGPPTSINTRITHLSDLVLRRWHIGYTSPAEAVRALPILAEMLQNKLGWDAQRTAMEIKDAYDAIMASVVTHKSMARN